MCTSDRARAQMSRLHANTARRLSISVSARSMRC
jgi:hypothetical protein